MFFEDSQLWALHTTSHNPSCLHAIIEHARGCEVFAASMTSHAARGITM
jgi:hypothetical protein